MKMRIVNDDISPAIRKILENTGQRRRLEILGKIALDCSNTQKLNISAERQFDGKPMKSPSKETKFGGRFAKSYNWRYREGTKMLGGKPVRRRIPVTAASKQLQDTGGTIKSIDILSIDSHRARVGPKTGHGQLILSVHDATRHPFGMSEEWKNKARETALNELLKGV